MFEYSYIIIPSLIVGFLSRISMLKVDYRQYPSYPQGFISHLTLGAIAAGLGSVAVPAMVSNEFAAITFLSLAAQQFRDVRNLERQSLDNIEPTELVARGTAYIEDIAKAFESRNYVTMIVSLVCSIVIYLAFEVKIPKIYSIALGVICGIVINMVLTRVISRTTLKDIASVKKVEITFEGPLMKLDGIGIMNIGLQSSRDIYLKSGLAVEINPYDDNAVAILANLGQRQAIQHNVTALLGIRKDVDEPDFTPIARRDPDTGRVLLSLVPMEPDEGCFIKAVKTTIILESANRKPLDTKIGRKASD